MCSKPHPQEGEVSGVVHHGNLKVAHHNLTAGVHILHQVVLDICISRRAQNILGAGTNWKSQEFALVSSHENTNSELIIFSVVCGAKALYCLHLHFGPNSIKNTYMSHTVTLDHMFLHHHKYWHSVFFK